MTENQNPKWTEKQGLKLLERLVGPELTLERIGQMFIIVILGVLIYVLIFGDYGLWRIRALKEEIARQDEEINALKAVQDSLMAERWRLINDPEYIEKLAREKYGMQRENEKVYKFYEEKKAEEKTN